MAECRSRIAEEHGENGPCRHATDLGMAFLNYLLAVKATRNLASVGDCLDGLAPDNDRGVGGLAAKKRVRWGWREPVSACRKATMVSILLPCDAGFPPYHMQG